MVINSGVIEATTDSGAIVVRIYYDNMVTPDQPQPLINGPRDFCLDVTNLSGRPARVEVTMPNKTVQTFTFGQGDPVTTGQVRSRTAAQMAAAGYLFRSDVAGISLA